MIRSNAGATLSFSLIVTALLVGVGACHEGAPTEDVSASGQMLSECSLTVTKNVYDGPSWWGTIAVKNASSASVSGLAVSFTVPTGVHCDHASAGWTYAQSGSTCSFKKSTGSLAAGASVTFNYSADSQSFTAATNVKPVATSCGATAGGTVDAGARVDSGAGTGAGAGGALVWAKANLTNFTSYPDPGSEECVQYNGCTWAGQFAALSSKQPESWVAANNILAVHSKDFAKYKLKTLRLRQGTKQIDAKVYDMCADSDCSGCCTANSKSTGFLIDVESYTAARFGTGDGIVEWACVDCP
jgi:hypothetical protein